MTAGRVRSRWTGPALAAVVVLGGVLATLFVVAGLRSAQHDNSQRVMDQRAQMALAAVRAETDRYRTLLETTAAGIAAGDELNWADFDLASAPLASAGLIGVVAVAYVVPVTTAEIPAAQAHWRAAGATDLTLRPEPGRDDHYFPIFSRVLNDEDGGASRTGTDLIGVPQPAAALRAAEETMRPAVSDTYVLVRDRGLPVGRQQQSFVFAAPVWTRAHDPVFRGWVVLGLRGGDFLAGVLDTVSQGQLDGSLVAVNSDGSRAEVARLSVPGDPDLSRVDPVPVADHVWELGLRADSVRLPGAGGELPAIVLTGGLILTGLLGWLVLVLATGRARARARVEEATAELRDAEVESRRQAGLLGAIMTTLGDGVSVVDGDGRVLLENPAARRLMGVDDAGGDPETWQEHYGAYRADGVTPMPLDEMPLIRALNGEQTDGVEVFIRNAGRPDGVLLSVDGRPLDPSAGLRGAVAVSRDITDLRRYEKDLAIFAGVVAHDLKAPLAIVRGHCELAIEDPGDEEELQYSLTRIIRSVDRMDTLIETLLAYSTARDAPLRIGDVELEPLIREVLQERAAALGGTGPEPAWSVEPLPAVRADPAMLRHVLDNLIGNAFKYVRPGAVPSATVTSGVAAPGWARIEVSDAGIGIPDPDKARIFESFHRAEGSAAYAGTGLGLAICQRIVERHGGEIGVEDNPGGGTRFHFTLPAVARETEIDMNHIPAEPVQDEDAEVRAALDRALAERAAILDSRLPGMGALPSAAPSSHDPAAARLHAPVPDHQHQD